MREEEEEDIPSWKYDHSDASRVKKISLQEGKRWEASWVLLRSLFTPSAGASEGGRGRGKGRGGRGREAESFLQWPFSKLYLKVAKMGREYE